MYQNLIAALAAFADVNYSGRAPTVAQVHALNHEAARQGPYKVVEVPQGVRVLNAKGVVLASEVA